MGNLMKTGISYSGTGTGVLMLNGINYTGVSRDGVAVSLKNNYLIGNSATTEYKSPIDANNYVELSGDTVILHRNNSDYHLYIYTPLLTAGHLYTISFESVSGTDGKFYVRTANDITTNPVIVSQVAQINDNSGLSITFIPQTDCYYGVCLWRSEYNNISVTNPQLVDYSAAIPDISNITFGGE